MNTLYQSVTIEQPAAQRATGCAVNDVTVYGFDDEPAPGAHLITQRRGYAHHGIYVGDGKVVHYAGFAGSAQRGPIGEVTLEQFAAGHAITVWPHPCPKYAGAEAVRRARSRLGENRYRLLTNNCEHFCAWCLFGESRSEQVHACFTHPVAALRALLCLITACVARGPKGKGGRFAARAA
ncbi:lecithin retinol acyltransferase family protein [Paraburkholderia solisilvae]|nr:lecithin retinol acyltransferase family protein [Paraburkholderia solisilvae]